MATDEQAKRRRARRRDRPASAWLWALAGLLLVGFSGRVPAPEPPPDKAPKPNDWIPFSALRAKLDLRVDNAPDGTPSLRNGANRLAFTPGSRRLVLNDTTVWLHAPLRWHNGQPLLHRVDVEWVLRPLLLPPRETPAPLRVLLDPGHGGADGGAVSRDGTLIEKDIVLEIALSTARHLTARGLAVGLTRATDQALSLADRVAIARAWPADVFISIHLNAAANTAAGGAEAFVQPAAGFPPTSIAADGPLPGYAVTATNSPTTARDSLLGTLLHQRQPLRRPALADRGLKRARFRVLSDSPCPAVLIECGFLSNPADAAALRDPRTRARIAEALAEGILAYALRVPLCDSD